MGKSCSLNEAISAVWAYEKRGHPVAIHLGAGNFVYDCSTHVYGVCAVLDGNTHASEIRLFGQKGQTSIETWPPNRTLFSVGVNAPTMEVTGIIFKTPLVVNGGELKLKDCTFENTNHPAWTAESGRRLAHENTDHVDGGALHISNGLSMLTVDNTNFSHCSGRKGGAIYAEAGSATFTNCIFRDCQAAERGGAVYVTKTATDTARVVLRDGTRLHGNYAADPSGTGTRLESIHIELTSSETRALVYRLPAPLGFFIDSNGAPELVLKPGIAYTDSNGELKPGVWYNDYPTQCAAGFFGKDTALSSQSSSVCSGACPQGKYCIRPATVNPAECDAGGFCPQGSPAPRLCPGGRYSDQTGLVEADQCVICNVGTSCTKGSTSESPCNPGRYSNMVEQPTCDECAAGKYQESTGETACVVCLKGGYCGAGAPLVKLCDEGTFGNETGLQEQNDCHVCPEGTECARGSTEPRDCSAGTFQDEERQGTCKPCEPGSFQDITRQTACKACGGGFYCPRGSISKTPIACDPGTFVRQFSPQWEEWTGQHNCTTCPMRSWCPGGGSDKKDCPSGTKGNETGLANCFACEAGKYQDQQGQSMCLGCDLGGYCRESAVVPTRCEAGTFGNRTNRTTQDDCFICPAGSSCALGASENTECAAGTVTNATGRAECDPCAAGRYQTDKGETSCNVCPRGSYCEPRSAAATPCPAGRFGNVTGNKAEADCHRCPPGFACRRGSDQKTACFAGSFMPNASAEKCLLCDPGTFQDKEGETACEACQPGKYCEKGVARPTLCPGGRYGNATNLTAAGECGDCPVGHACAAGSRAPTPCQPGTKADKTRTILCDYCAKGTYQNSSQQTSCNECRPGNYCPQGSSAELPCEGGTYSGNSSLGAASQCSICPVGHACFTGAEKKEPCNPGTHAATEGQRACTLCEKGKYQPSKESTSCLPCSAGSYCPEEGASSPTPCPGGTYSNTTGLILEIECTDVEGPRCRKTDNDEGTLPLCSTYQPLFAFCKEKQGQCLERGEWAPTGSRLPEACPASGFRCPGRSADDVNEVKGSKPISVDSGETTVETEVKTVTFELSLHWSLAEYAVREAAIKTQLAAYYGVNESMIVVDASVSDHGRRLSHGGNGTSTSRSLKLKVTITVPDAVPANGNAAGGDTDSSPTTGGGGGPTQNQPGIAPGTGELDDEQDDELDARAARFKDQIYRLNNDTLGLRLLFNVSFNVTTTVPAVDTETKEVVASCPTGYWCSAGLQIECGLGSFNDLIDQNSAGACKPCPADSHSAVAAKSSSDCKCLPGYYAAILDLIWLQSSETARGRWARQTPKCRYDATTGNLVGRNQEAGCDLYDAWEDQADRLRPAANVLLGPDCQLCPNPGANCTREAQEEMWPLMKDNTTNVVEGFTIETLPLEVGYWRLSNRSVDIWLCKDWKCDERRASGEIASSVDECESRRKSACVGGAGYLMDDGSVSYCSNTTSGPLCESCDRDAFSKDPEHKLGTYRDTEKNSCEPCGGRDDDTLLYVYLFSFIGVLLLFVISGYYARKSRRVRALVGAFGRFRNRLSLRAKLKALYSFFQISSKMDKVYQVTMPSTIRDFFKSLPFVTLDIDFIGPLECFGLGGFRDELQVALIMPLSVVFCVFSGFMVYRLGNLAVARVKAAVRGKQVPMYDLGEKTAKRVADEELPKKGEGPLPGFGEAFVETVFDALPALLVVLYSVAPSAYNKAFSMYQCVTYYEMPDNLPWWQDVARDSPDPEVDSNAILEGFGVQPRGSIKLSQKGTMYQAIFEEQHFLLADLDERCELFGDSYQPKDTHIANLGVVVLILFCAVVPMSYIVLLLRARKPILDSMQEATRLSTALKFLYQECVRTARTLPPPYRLGPSSWRGDLQVARAAASSPPSSGGSLSTSQKRFCWWASSSSYGPERLFS